MNRILATGEDGRVPDLQDPNLTVMPGVSICVPVYNGAQFIGETLQSILGQTYRNFEVVVTDNCSSDDTVQIVRSFVDPRIRLIINEANLGAIGNFNRAIAATRGKRVKIVCADDLIGPTCLAEQVAALDANPAAVLVCCRRGIIDHRGRRWMSRRFPGLPCRLPGPDAIARAISSGTNPFGEPVAVLMDRDALMRVGGFDDQWKYCVDLDLWCRLLLQGDAVIQDDELCSFRVSPGSWSAGLVAAQADEFERFVNALQRDHVWVASAVDISKALRRSRLHAKLRQLLYKVLFSFRP